MNGRCRTCRDRRCCRDRSSVEPVPLPDRAAARRRAPSARGRDPADAEGAANLVAALMTKGTAKMDLHPDPAIILEGDDHIAVFAELATLGKLNALAKRKPML